MRAAFLFLAGSLGSACAAAAPADAGAPGTNVAVTAAPIAVATADVQRPEPVDTPEAHVLPAAVPAAVVKPRQVSVSDAWNHGNPDEHTVELLVASGKLTDAAAEQFLQAPQFIEKLGLKRDSCYARESDAGFTLSCGKRGGRKDCRESLRDVEISAGKTRLVVTSDRTMNVRVDDGSCGCIH